MSVLGICGSPHPKGNTAYALHHALRVVEEEGVSTRYIALHELDIQACEGCFHCRSGQCVHDDDMGMVIEALQACDSLLLASPVYMGMITGQLKTMIDRTVILRVGRNMNWLTGRFAAGIACGGFRNGGQELTLQQMQTFFLQLNMQALSDGVPYSHSGAAISGTAREDIVGMTTVENVARNVAQAVLGRRKS